jgi:ABC-type multidrug transport system fused ATPase/permease subunit
MSTIQKADSIVVLERGKVVQNGPPARLAEEDGLFRRFVQAQSPTGPDITTA